MKAFITGAEHVFIIENSFTGQLDRLIRYVVGPLRTLHPVLKYNGKPFRPIEIIDAVNKFAPAREPAGVR
jgi:pyruvate/2-oxoacid:ferredoxin oxidoreductase alpha subunit